MYLLLDNGQHGTLVRRSRTNPDTHATVRTATGAHMAGRVARRWVSEVAANRDRHPVGERAQVLRRQLLEGGRA